MYGLLCLCTDENNELLCCRILLSSHIPYFFFEIFYRPGPAVFQHENTPFQFIVHGYHETALEFIIDPPSYFGLSLLVSLLPDF